MGVLPEECLMIGDTTVDIRAGRSAGAQTVGVLCGFGSEDELQRAGADLILPTPLDVLKYLALTGIPVPGLSNPLIQEKSLSEAG
jgi:phosphoglycolate phosphatase-like HAD superfamily hydrolase